MELLITERRAYMVKHGWVALQEPMTMTLKYNRQRREGLHQFSASSIGEMFGYREYGEIIPLKDFLTLPLNVLEDLLDSVAVGKRKAKEAAERANKSKGIKIPNAEDLVKGLKL